MHFVCLFMNLRMKYSKNSYRNYGKAVRLFFECWTAGACSILVCNVDCKFFQYKEIVYPVVHEVSFIL